MLRQADPSRWRVYEYELKILNNGAMVNLRMIILLPLEDHYRIVDLLVA